MTALIGAIVSGVLYGFSFPPHHSSYLAWFAMVPLFYTATTSKRQLFRDGFLCGLIANLILFFWFWKTFNAAHIAKGTTFSAWITLASILALYFSAISFLYGRLEHSQIRPWLIALAWIVLETVRTHILTGFPWALFGHTQAYNRPLLQLASVAGEAGISFLLMFSNAALADFLKSRRTHTAINLLLAAHAILGIHSWGRNRIAEMDFVIRQSPTLRVALLQANIDQYQKWDDAYEAGIRKTYDELAVKAAENNPDLIVWPESAVPGWYPNQLPYVFWVRSVVQRTKTKHLIGAVTSHDKSEYNAAFLIGADGEMIAEYDKQHMVPFGEYIPFGGALKRWIPYLGQLGTFNRGNGPVLFHMAGATVAPNICYEAIFAGLVQKSAKNADVIVNITNDGWFLDTNAPEQHYVTNLFRAVETGRSVIRAANTGISAVIDPTGREIIRSPLLVSGVYEARVPLHRFQTFLSLLYSDHVTRTKKPN